MVIGVISFPLSVLKVHAGFLLPWGSASPTDIELPNSDSAFPQITTTYAFVFDLTRYVYMIVCWCR